ncbi:MAG: M48 family metallopeptidase [Amylibacter sp.]|nr:M48 family metallopeptidase [Amylibacter sp.]
MKKKLLSLAILPLLAACVSTTGPAPAPTKPPVTKPQPVVTRSAQSGLAAFARVSRRVEPVAERSCRQIHKNANPKFCDFVIKVNKDPRQPANAYQSIGQDGRPVITFNINMIRSIQNDHEIAFILGHEAGHQIAKHLGKTRQNQVAGAVLGGLLAAALGADMQSGADLGGLVGARSYSKGFELQADRIGTHIASRAGYNPVIGARSFNRTQGSNAFLSTHPPSQDRINTVNQTAARIRAAKAAGQGTPPITW